MRLSRLPSIFISLACITFLSAQPSAAVASQEVYTHTLSASNAEFQLWTAPPSHRVFKDEMAPIAESDSIKVYAAKNEYEPFQIVVQPSASGDATVTMSDFGPGITTEMYQVKYVNISQATDSLGSTGPYPDPLWPVENAELVQLTADENTAFWVSINISPSVAAGEYLAHFKINDTTVPVTLHVFDFAIPEELHVKSQMNLSDQAILQKYGVTGTGSNYWMYVRSIKEYFIDHRLTPKGVLWSGGLTAGGTGAAPYIDYDCNGTLTDNDGIWGFEIPANTYLKGDGFNDGTGFPSFMLASFANNDASYDQRPSTFCGSSKTTADWYTADNPESSYNQKWKQYMATIQSYLAGLDYLDKSYYYIANEPQDQADYDAVAWYSQLIKSAAPNIKLMVSEEPKAEIYAHPTYSGAKIDIWLPVLNNYDPTISHDRALNHNEESWVYFLHGTRPPYFNPITLDHPGIESKLTGWFLWKYRIRGIAYYSMNNWGKNPWTAPMTSGHNGDLFMLYPPSESNDAIAFGANNHRFVPSIRFELMRDSLEDYEYLFLLNQQTQPAVGSANAVDPLVDKIISGLTSYTRDDDFIYNLRRLIGLKNGGEIDIIPDIHPPSSHPRTIGPPADYFLNFQDPGGQPTLDPLIVDDKEYMKIGWSTYDQAQGYGWYGDMAHIKYQYLSAGPNELQKSILYDDWGRQKTFEFDLPNGEYDVTVSVGWYDQWNTRRYAHHKIDIEGVSFIDDEPTWNPEQPYLVRSHKVVVRDKKLTLAMGIFNEYTMLNYLDIEASEAAFPAGDYNCSGRLELDDAIAIFKTLVGLSSTKPAGCPDLQGDFNNNSRVGLEDGIGILENLSGYSQ